MRLFYCLTLLLCSIQIKAQTPVYWYDADEDFIEYLLTEKINELRIQNGINPLKNDLNLTKTANSRAKFLIDKLGKGSGQTSKKFTTKSLLQKLGANPSSVNEFVINCFLKNTYEEIVEILFNQIYSDKVKLNAIKNSDNIYSGIGCYIDDNGIIILVLILSSNYNDAEIFEQKASPRPPDINLLPYQLKPYSRDYEVESIVKAAHFETDGNRIYSHNPEQILKLFRNNKDGIIREVVFKSSVNCENELYNKSYNRRNNNSSINGRLYYPYYKKDLIKNEHFKISKENHEYNKIKSLEKIERRMRIIRTSINKTKVQLRNVQKQKSHAKNKEQKFALAVKKKDLKDQKKIFKEIIHQLKRDKKDCRKLDWKPFYWSVSFPDEKYFQMDSIAEVNTLIIRNNKVVYPLYYGNIKAKGSLQDSIQLDSIEFNIPEIKIKPNYKELNTTVDFERNETQIISDEFDEFKLNLNDYLIDTINLVAFASIEGSYEINKKLFKARADSLYESLSQYHANDIVFRSQMKENWEELYRQLDENEEYKHWSKLGKDSVRALINSHVGTDKWDVLLKHQRQSNIRVVYHENINDTIRYLRKYYDFEIYRDLKRVVDYLIYQSLKGEFNKDYIQKFRLNKDSTLYSPLILKKYLFEYEINKNRSDFNLNRFFRNFLNNINTAIASDELLITYFDLLVHNWGKFKPNIVENFKVFEALKIRGINRKSMALFAYHALPYYWQYFQNSKAKYYNDYVGAEHSVREFPEQIFNYYINDPSFMNDYDKCKELALFFIEYKYNDYANQLLEEYQNLHTFDPDFRALQLKILYAHPEIDEAQYVKLLIYEHARLSKEEWCSLFNSEYPISFQSLDNQELRTMFCIDCATESEELISKSEK